MTFMTISVEIPTSSFRPVNDWFHFDRVIFILLASKNLWSFWCEFPDKRHAQTCSWTLTSCW